MNPDTDRTLFKKALAALTAGAAASRKGKELPEGRIPRWWREMKKRFTPLREQNLKASRERRAKRRQQKQKARNLCHYIRQSNKGKRVHEKTTTNLTKIRKMINRQERANAANAEKAALDAV